MTKEPQFGHLKLVSIIYSESGTSGNFKQIGISKDPDNSDTSSANANAYCVINTGEHIFKLTTGV